MPPRNNPNNSNNTSKKKKGRAPKHQNTFAFRHNPKSKKTEKILSSPNVGVCRRCYEKIEWRKKYRKYKPRTQPGKCNLCAQKNVLAAYHTICTNCAVSDNAILALEKRQREQSSGATSATSSDQVGVFSNDNGEVVVVAGSENDELPIANSDVPQHSKSDFEDDANGRNCSDGSILSNGNTKLKRRIRVCAVCTQEPALSKYSNMDGADGDLQDRIHELEEVLDSGVHSSDGHKLTLREVKGMERQLEKLKLEAKKRLNKNRENSEEEDVEEGEEKDGDDREGKSNESEDGSENSKQDEDGDEDDEEEYDSDEANDPFLLAVGGKDKLLVGEEYQKMLFEKERQKQQL